MNDDEFQIIGLYSHNANSYKIIKDAYASGENIVGIVHATGTGKSYIALQFIYDNRDKKIILLRYYFDKTQSEIAKQLNISQVQVSRLENKILTNLRNKLTN